MSPPKGFTIEINEPEGDHVVITIKGDLDMAAAPDLTEAIVGAKDHAVVSIDLSGVTFLDSTAIGALVASGRSLSEAGSRLTIGPRSDVVTRVLEITGLADTSEAFDVLPGDA